MNLVQHVMRRGLLKEEAIAHSRAAALVARQPLDKMPRLKPLLRQRDEWMKRADIFNECEDARRAEAAALAAVNAAIIEHAEAVKRKEAAIAKAKLMEGLEQL